MVDTEGTLSLTTRRSTVDPRSSWLFFQKPYILKDGVTYGTSLKLKAVQVVSLCNSAGVDTGDMDDTDVAELFGSTQGFKVGDPNVTLKEAEPRTKMTSEPDTKLTKTISSMRCAVTETTAIR